MATRVEKKPSTAAAPKKGAAVELEVLHPERELVLAGRAITVREYTFMEGTRLAPVAKPFQDLLYQRIATSDTPPGFDAISQLFEACPDLVATLVAQACVDIDLPKSEQQLQHAELVEFIDKLDDRDGYLLFLAWWLANMNFFIQRALRRAAEEKRALLSAGVASTQPSSGPDTETPPSTSGDSPTGN